MRLYFAVFNYFGSYLCSQTYQVPIETLLPYKQEPQSLISPSICTYFFILNLACVLLSHKYNHLLFTGDMLACVISIKLYNKSLREEKYSNLEIKFAINF